MQKIRNRSNFFQKNFHIRYISKNSENSTAFLKKICTSGILPKILKTFSLFRTFFKKSFYGILRQTGHRHFNNTLCTNSPNSPNSPKLPSTGVISKITINCALPFLLFSKNLISTPLYISFYHQKCCTSFQFFSKNFHSPSTGVISKICHDCVVAFRKNLKKTSPLHQWLSRLPPVFVTPIFNFFQKTFTPLPGLYPKRHPVVLLLSEKIPKNIISTPLTIKITPLICHTPFQLFSKIFTHPLLTITFFLLFVSPPLLLFWKIFLYTADCRKNTLFCITRFRTFSEKLSLFTLDYRKNISKALHLICTSLENLPERE